MAHPADGERNPLVWPFIISFIGHILLFGIFLYQPGWERSSNAPFASVINVQMVEMPVGKPATEKAAQSDPKALVRDRPRLEKSAQPEVAANTAQQAEVSVAAPQPKSKTALKYKTFKSQEVLKSALQQLEKKVETSSPKPLEDTIQRLREQVAKEGRPESNQTEATAEGKNEGYAFGSKQEGEAIDIYRLEVAYAINKNWAYAEQLSGGENLVASVVFKIMPDGTIEDIFFTDRSGHAYLDDSALKAIVKSSPVKPHPEGISRPYIELGLRFTPKGVQ